MPAHSPAKAGVDGVKSPPKSLKKAPPKSLKKD